jgi:ubiquinone/menaquinone biosynthesis C-methylase UbiE
MSTIREDGLTHEDYFRMRDGSRVLKRHARFLVSRFFRWTEDGRILEVGCGAGFLLSHLRAALPASFSFVGSDVDRTMLRLSCRVKGAKGISFVQNDDQSLPFRDRSFQGIVCDGTFHHFEQPEKMFADMYRILAPGGEMVILNIDSGFLFARLFRIYYRLKNRLRLATKPDFALYNSIRHSPSLRDMRAFLERNPLGEQELFRKRTFFLARVRKPPA